MEEDDNHSHLPSIENDWWKQVKEEQVFTEYQNLGTVELGHQQHHHSRTQTLNSFNQANKKFKTI